MDGFDLYDLLSKNWKQVIAFSLLAIYWVSPTTGNKIFGFILNAAIAKEQAQVETLYKPLIQNLGRQSLMLQPKEKGRDLPKSSPPAQR